MGPTPQSAVVEVETSGQLGDLNKS